MVRRSVSSFLTGALKTFLLWKLWSFKKAHQKTGLPALLLLLNHCYGSLHDKWLRHIYHTLICLIIVVLGPACVSSYVHVLRRDTHKLIEQSVQ